MIRQRIRAALLHAGMTQKELAEKVKIAPQSLSDFLQGRRGIPFDKLDEIFKILGI